MAQWLSADPVSGEPRYSYARQMPVLKADPAGEAPGNFWSGVADATRRFLGERLGFLPGADRRRVLNLGKLGLGLLVPAYATHLQLEAAQKLVAPVLGTADLLSASSNRLIAMIPQRAKNYSGTFRRDPAAWTAKLLLGVLAGFGKELADTVTARETLEQITQLMAVLWEALGQEDLGVKVLWDRYVQDPLLNGLEAFLGGAFLEPEAIGEMVGPVYFQVFLTIVLAVVAALLTEGAGEPAVLALQGTRLGRIVNSIRASQRLAPTLQRAQRLRSRVVNHPGVRAFSRNVHEAEAARDRLKKRLADATHAPNTAVRRLFRQKPPLPPVLAEVRYRWNTPAQRVGARGERRLAELIHHNGTRVGVDEHEIVVVWGHDINHHGAGIISVNGQTGAVTVWDAKGRSPSAGGRVYTQPRSRTFVGPANLTNRISEAERAIMDSTFLDPHLRDLALDHLTYRRLSDKTVTIRHDTGEVVGIR